MRRQCDARLAHDAPETCDADAEYEGRLRNGGAATKHAACAAHAERLDAMGAWVVGSVRRL